MPNSAQTFSIVTIVVLALGTQFWFNGYPQQGADWLSAVSTAASSLGLAIFLFHLGLWRVCPSWLTGKPDINGTWRATARTWPSEGRDAVTFTGFMIVKQKYFTMSMRLLTPAAASELVAEQFVVRRNGGYELWAIYFCEPRRRNQPGSVKEHYGAMCLEFVGDGPDARLEGRYWVDGPLEDGHLTLSDRRLEWFDNYESAEAAFR